MTTSVSKVTPLKLRWTAAFLVVGLVAMVGCTGSESSTDHIEHSGQFGGFLAGTDALIGISSGPERVTVLVSNNSTVSEWFVTDAPADELILSSTDGAVAELQFIDDAVTGAITLTTGERHMYSAEPQSSSAIRRAQAASEDSEVLAGWVTVDDRTKGALSIQPRKGSRIVGPAPSVPAFGEVSLPTPKGPVTAPLTTVTGDATFRTANRPLTYIVAGVGDSYASGEGNPVDVPRDSEGNRDPRGRPANLTQMWGGTDGMAGCHRSDNAAYPKAFRALQDKYQAFSMELIFVACGGSRIEHVTGRPPGQAPGAGEASAWGQGTRGDADGEQTDRWIEIDEPAQLGQVEARMSEMYGNVSTPPLDLLLMSIGGNDAGFATAVGDCISGGLPADLVGMDPDEGAVASLAPKQCIAGSRLSRALDDDGLPPRDPTGNASDDRDYRELRQQVPGWNAVLDRYDALAKTLDRYAELERPIGQVLITQYGAGLKNDDGDYCGGLNGAGDGDLFGFVDTGEAEWLDTKLLAALNAHVDIAAERANADGVGPRWTVVDAHVAQFESHGPCATQPWTHRNNTALVAEGNNFPDYPDDPGRTRENLSTLYRVLNTPGGFAIGCGVGAIINLVFGPLGCAVGAVVGFASAEESAISTGMAHPNDRGWTAVSDAVLPEMEGTFKRTFTPLPADRLRQHTAIENGPIEIRWDDRSSTDSRYEINIIDLTDPSQPVTQGVSLPANAVSHVFDPAGPFVGTFTVRACNEAFCSPFGAPTKITNIRAGVPTEVSALIKEYPSLVGVSHTGLTVLGTDPQNADTAARIELTQLTNSVGEPVERDPVVMTSPAPFPSGFSVGGSDGLAPGRYQVRAASCNVLGCSDFSDSVESVEAVAGPPTLVLEQPPFFMDRLGLIRPGADRSPFDPPGTGPSVIQPDSSGPGHLGQPPTSGRPGPDSPGPFG